MKKFARTLDQAFPFGPEYGCAITRVHKTSLVERLFGAFIAVCLFAVALALMLAYFDVLVP